NLDHGNRYNEFKSRMLSDDVLREVPREHEHVVRLRFVKRRDRPNLNVLARCEEPMLDGVVVHDEVEHLRSESERVHQCAALGGRAITDDASALLFEARKSPDEL